MPAAPTSAPRRATGVALAGLAVLASLAAAPPVADAVPAGAPPPVRYVDRVFDDVVVTSDLVYGSSVWEDGVERDLRLDLYEPAGDTAEDRPVVVWMHGGSFSGGSKTSGGSSDFARDWALRGWVAASIDYRLASSPVSGSGWGSSAGATAIVNAHEDAQMAVAWLRAHALELGINPEVVVATGYSAGGVMADNLAYLPARHLGRGTDDDPAHVDAAIPLAGATLGGFVQAGEPPALMHHGDADTTVPYSLAAALHRSLVAAGVDSTLHTYPGTAHGLFPFYDDLRDESAAWAHDRLLEGHAPPTTTELSPRTVHGDATVWLTGDGVEATASVRAGAAGTYLPTGTWLSGSPGGAPPAAGWSADVGDLPVGFHRLWVSTRGGVAPPGWHTRLAVADPAVLAGSPPFTDVAAGHPFAEEATWAAATGLVEGYPDGRLGSEEAVSRQAMAAVTYRMAGTPDGPDPACTAAPFPDVPVDHPFCGEVAWAAGEGITTGYADGTFRPGAPLSRQAMAAMVHRATALPPTAVAVPPTFPDVPVHHPFAVDVEWLVGAGLVTGYPDATFRPAAVATRQALVAVTARAFRDAAVVL